MNKMNVKVSIGARLKQLRAKRDISQQQIAQDFNLSTPSMVSKYESGSIQMPIDLMVGIPKKYNVRLEWWFYGEGGIDDENPVERGFTCVSVVSIGKKGTIEQTGMLPVLNEYLVPYDAEQVKALKVQGDAMVPDVWAGDYVLYVHDEVLLNDLYVIRYKDQLDVRSIQFNYDDTITVISHNLKYDKQVIPRDSGSIKIVGRVIGWIHRHF
jgi:transcriptional regulator with XRE-family HTH domain